MKKLNLLWVCLFSLSVYAQNNVQIHRDNQIRQWNITLGERSFFDQYKKQLGLTAEDQMREKHSKIDFSGIKRSKYQQFYKGIRVQGAQYTLHSKKDRIIKSTGSIYPHIELAVEPSAALSSCENLALISTQDHLRSHHQIKNVHEVPLEVSSQEIIIVDKDMPNFSGDYALAYEMIVVSKDPSVPVKQKVIVDAHTGQLIKSYSEICQHSVPATGSGNYYKDVSFTVDSINAQQYELRDEARNISIFEVFYEGGSRPMQSPDNKWEFEGDVLRSSAIDAMYASTAYYDMLKDQFGRNSIDDKGGELICNINAPFFSRSPYYINAFWNGYSSNYGAGDCQEYGPLTSLSIVSHEFTHGLTDYTSNLVYADESGALNESMSDIFGESLEYLENPDGFSWVIGSEILLDTGVRPIRNMQDPNLTENPKYYNGEYWEPGGSVHNNSGVMNHWYYLLVEGGEGVNEAGEAYDIEGIGLIDAFQIVYLNQAAYLTENSNYLEARSFSEQAAIDLFGENSIQHQSVIDAWTAVGVGEIDIPVVYNIDIESGNARFDIFACLNRATNLFSFPLHIQNLGKTLTKNQDIKLSIKIRGFQATYFDSTLNIVFNDSLEFREIDTIFVEFPITPSQIEEIQNAPFPAIDVEIFMDNNSFDMINNNFIFINNYPDIALANVYKFRFCLANPDIFLLVNNNSCNKIAEGTEIEVEITDNNSNSVIKNFSIFEDIKPGEEVFYRVEFDRANIESFEPPLTATLIYDEDLEVENNSANLSFSLLDETLDSAIVDFEDSDYDSQIDIRRHEIVSYKDDRWLAVSNLIPEELVANPCLNTKELMHLSARPEPLTICIDNRNLVKPQLSFDAVFFDSYQEDSEIPEHWASSIQVHLIGGSSKMEDTSIYFISEQNDGAVVNHVVNLPEGFIGNVELELAAVRRTVSVSNEIGVGTYVLVDDIQIVGEPSSSDDPTRSSLTIYPNPTSDLLYLPANANFDQCRIIDLMGRTVETYSSAEIDSKLHVGHLPKGTYLIELKKQGTSQIEKFIKL